MPKIVGYVSKEAGPTRGSGVIWNPEYGFAKGLQQAGKSFEEMGASAQKLSRDLKEREDRNSIADAEKARVALEKRAEEERVKYEQEHQGSDVRGGTDLGDDVEPKDYHTKWTERFTEFKTTALEGVKLNAAGQEHFDRHVNSMELRFASRALEHQAKQEEEARKEISALALDNGVAIIAGITSVDDASAYMKEVVSATTAPHIGAPAHKLQFLEGKAKEKLYLSSITTHAADNTQFARAMLEKAKSENVFDGQTLRQLEGYVNEGREVQEVYMAAITLAEQYGLPGAIKRITDSNFVKANNLEKTAGKIHKELESRASARRAEVSFYRTENNQRTADRMFIEIEKNGGAPLSENRLKELRLEGMDVSTMAQVNASAANKSTPQERELAENKLIVRIQRGVVANMDALLADPDSKNLTAEQLNKLRGMIDAGGHDKVGLQALKVAEKMLASQVKAKALPSSEAHAVMAIVSNELKMGELKVEGVQDRVNALTVKQGKNFFGLGGSRQSAEIVGQQKVVRTVLGKSATGQQVAIGVSLLPVFAKIGLLPEKDYMEAAIELRMHGKAVTAETVRRRTKERRESK